MHSVPVCRVTLVLAFLLQASPAFCQTQALGFDGTAPVVLGQAGATVAFELFATLTTAANPAPDGAQGWSLSLTADGGVITGTSFDGITVATRFDDDGDPATALVDPFLLDLKDAQYRVNQLAINPAGGSPGAIAAIVLHQERKMVLQPNGVARIARVRVEAQVPPEGQTREVTIRFEDGFKGSGVPTKNRVIFDGLSVLATLGSQTVVVAPTPPAPKQLPGDCNQDSSLDLSDGICLLDNLFVTGRELPCASEASSTALLDSNGDSFLDIGDAIRVFNYLFIGGPPHPLGESCAPIDGCPASCG